MQKIRFVKLNGFYEIILPKKSIIKTIELFFTLPYTSEKTQRILRFRVDLNYSASKEQKWFIVQFDEQRYQKVIVDKSVSDSAILRMSSLPSISSEKNNNEFLFLFTCIVP